MKEINIRDIEGMKIGNAQSFEAATGCTVVICEEGAVAGVDVRGGAPGTRETDLLDPVNLVGQIHAVLLSGGSAYGLDAASGVMQYLEEKNIGFDVGVTKVPIVPAVVLFDLNVGDYRVRPDKDMGYAACINAEEMSCRERQQCSAPGNEQSEGLSYGLQGCVGAGTGATIGKINGPEYAMKGGLGSCCLQVGDLTVGAVVAVNCLGDVVDPDTGEIVAGALKEDKISFADTEEVLLGQYDGRKNPFNGNTTIGVVITNACLTKAQAKKIASMAHNGYGRTMRPAHTMHDGDTIFTMGTGRIDADVTVIGLLAARVVEQAVLRAARNAESMYGYTGYKEIKGFED